MIVPFVTFKQSLYVANGMDNADLDYGSETIISESLDHF